MSGSEALFIRMNFAYINAMSIFMQGKYIRGIALKRFQKKLA